MRKSCYVLDISEVLPSASFWTGCGGSGRRRSAAAPIGRGLRKTSPVQVLGPALDCVAGQRSLHSIYRTEYIQYSAVPRILPVLFDKSPTLCLEGRPLCLDTLLLSSKLCC